MQADLTGEARLAKFSEAEQLLLESNDSMHANPEVRPKYRRHSIVRLVRLYTAMRKEEKAAEWRIKLKEHDALHAKEMPDGRELPSKP